MLTERQSSLLRFIVAYQDKHGGVSPSNREMAAVFGLYINPDNSAGNSGIFRLLSALEERGYIRRLKQRARAIEVLKRPDPLVLSWKGQRYRFISAEELAA